MTITAFPINAASGAPVYSSQQFRQAMAALMSPGATGLAVQPGVRPGAGLDVTVSGTTITVTAGVAVIQGGSSNVQGPYFVYSDAAVTLTLTAANATNPRVDLVYARVRDTDADASGARDGSILYLAGNPAASPVAPTPTDASYVVLATINVPKSGSGSPATSYATRPYTAAAGGVTVGSVAPPNPYLGQLWDSGDGTRRWSGTAWRYLVLEPQVSFQVNQPTFSTTSSWVAFASGDWAPISFVVPPSGMAWIQVSGAVQNTNSSTSTAWMGWGASGGYVESPSEGNGISTWGGRLYGDRRSLRRNLTVGSTITITPYWQVSSAGTPTTVTRIDHGQLTVEPVV